jgi:hypothetical protein
MTIQRNAPGLAKTEGVVCLLPGDIDAHNTDRARVQYLARRGLPFLRAGLIAGLAFGATAHG